MSRPWVRCGAGRRSPAVPEEGPLCAARTRDGRFRLGAPPREGDAARREHEVSHDESVQPPNMDPVHDASSAWSGTTRGEETPHSRLRALTRRTALTGGAAGLRPRSDGLRLRRRQQQQQRRPRPRRRPAAAGRRAASSRPSKKYKFVFVNHVTTNPFFVPDAVRRRGRLQAARLHATSGPARRTRNVNEMVNAFNTRRSPAAPTASPSRWSTAGVQRPDRRGAEGEDPGRRLQRGREPERAAVPTSARTCSCPARRWASTSSSSSPSGDVALFIATPGPANIQPRIDGAETRSSVRSGRSRRTWSPRAPRVPAELSVIDSYATATRTPRAISRSTPAAPRASRRRSRSTTCATRASRAAATTSRRRPRSCWPTTRSTSRSTSSPTCRASCPVLQLYMYKVSQALSGIADVNTGLKFLDKTTVDPVQQHQEPLRGHLVRGRRDLA